MVLSRDWFKIEKLICHNASKNYTLVQLKNTKQFFQKFEIYTHLAQNILKLVSYLMCENFRSFQ